MSWSDHHRVLSGVPRTRCRRPTRIRAGHVVGVHIHQVLAD
ncbi:hypothetical protein BTZ20_0068 [Rhodococcus sp. MTM3W5.2]|nr:hypothetical protein BTZ20_0068 [Rhodococcus sp. MTM3W5.2]